ncbi:MAG: hypothetical protein KME27_18615 [Lyngbya sp. HA4199-MV5]|jgi:hypothetical protein|nr:hypothetical protein [Lyngbya sp. HA4199-MV5]
MNSPDPCVPLKPLETNNAPIEPSTTAVWRGLSFFQQRWQWLIKTIAHANPLHVWRPNELHVWQCTDRDGRLYWQAYDPITGRSTSGSEADIRAWIEHLHYLKR